MLSLENISIQRGGRVILEHVSTSLDAGTACILRGPNGVGKTSLLRVIAGLCKPVAGGLVISAQEVMYHGHDNALKPQLTLAENLYFWAQIHGSHHKVEEALDAFDLLPLAPRPAHFLSAGQKRRAGLSRLLLAQGKGALWLLDEPTVSLDQSSVKRFSNIVQAHLQAGGAALIATHIALGLEASDLNLEAYMTKTTSQQHQDEAFL